MSEIPSSGEDDDAYSYEVKSRLVTIMLRDDSCEFVSLVKSVVKKLYESELYEKGKYGYYSDLIECDPFTREEYMRKFGIWQYDLLSFCCGCHAVNCVAAFLEWETTFLVDLNILLSSEDHQYPLHTAASVLDFDLVELLLRHGARTDFRSFGYAWENDLLPLEVALGKISGLLLFDWNPKESVYKLFVMLCLPEMKKPLEIIRLLALRMEEVDKFFINLARVGKPIEMAVLLMAARKRVMGSNTSQSNDSESMGFIQSIKDEFWTMILEESKSIMSQGERNKPICGPKRALLISVLFLVELFEKAGDAIELYLQSQPSYVTKRKVVEDVAKVLNDAGFLMKGEDIDLSNITCKSFDVNGASVPTEAYRSYLHNKQKPKSSFYEEDFVNWPQGMKTGSRKISGAPRHSSIRQYNTSAANSSMRAHFKGETYRTQRPVLSSKFCNVAFLVLKRGARRA